jgi:transposase
MPTVSLSSAERRALERALASARDRRQWCRLRTVLLVAEGVPILTITQALGISRASVYGWVAQYLGVRTPGALAEAPRSGRPCVLDATARARLATLVTQSPRAHGYHTFGWTVALLARHLRAVEGCAVSAPTLRRALHALGYRWKRPRFVLARQDPEREGKKMRPAGARCRHT